MNQNRVDWVAELSETYGRIVFSTAYRVLGNPQDAEDVLQEVFLKLLGGWSGRIKTDAVRDWGAYLRVTALRTAIDLLRSKAKHKQENWESVQEFEASNDPSPRSLASQKQKACFLRQALGQLPEREAKVFAMRYFEDFSYEAIAEHLSMTVNQVGVLLYRIRERLREILQPIIPHERKEEDAPARSRIREEMNHV